MLKEIETAIVNENNAERLLEKSDDCSYAEALFNYDYEKDENFSSTCPKFNFDGECEENIECFYWTIMSTGRYAIVTR